MPRELNAIMAPQRYPNKLKHSGYWGRYEKSGGLVFKKVWNLILEVIDEEGMPFELSRASIAQLKFQDDVRVYAAFPIFMAYFNLNDRTMGGALEFLAGDRLDHANVNRWFQRLNPDYVQKLISALDEKISKIYGSEDHYIGDSTGISTSFYREQKIKINNTLKKITRKLHILVSYFKKNGVISIKKAHVTDGNVHDSPVFRNHLLKNIRLRKGLYMHLDKGYDAQENMKACFKNNIIPNIRERNNNSGGIIRIKARKYYNDKLRKQTRGLVEGIFGGTQTRYNNHTRRQKPHTQTLHILLITLSHNLKTYLRALTDTQI